MRRLTRTPSASKTAFPCRGLFAKACCTSHLLAAKLHAQDVRQNGVLLDLPGNSPLDVKELHRLLAAKPFHAEKLADEHRSMHQEDLARRVGTAADSRTTDSVSEAASFVTAATPLPNSANQQLPPSHSAAEGDFPTARFAALEGPERQSEAAETEESGSASPHSKTSEKALEEQRNETQLLEEAIYSDPDRMAKFDLLFVFEEEAADLAALEDRVLQAECATQGPRKRSPLPAPSAFLALTTRYAKRLGFAFENRRSCGKVPSAGVRFPRLDPRDLLEGVNEAYGSEKEWKQIQENLAEAFEAHGARVV